LSGKDHARFRPRGRKPVTTRRSAAETTIAGVGLTHPERVLYPAQGVTKSALARYYESIADWMLPELRGRPTTLVRCPEGLRKECFYQKHVPAGAPPALRRVAIQEKHKVGEYLVVDDLAGLVSLVQIGILEVHTWNSRADTLEEPDRLVFDLDPAPGLGFPRVVEAALRVRERLRSYGLESFVKTTGGKGLHLVVPLSRGASWEACAAFSRAVAGSIVKDEPRAYTANMSKAARTGKVFIDYLRNLRGATSVAAYSTRAREGAPVATPLAWEELHEGLQPGSFTISSVPSRLAALPSDPWRAYGRTRQILPK
jgi:bifunctional non-homologous end joining protein LigD